MSIEDQIREAVAGVVEDTVRRVIREELAKLTAQGRGEGEYLSPKGAAAFAGVSEDEIRELVGKGALTDCRLSDGPRARIRVKKTELVEYMERTARARKGKPQSVEDRADAILNKHRK